jgi:hypothetical protein
VKSKGGRQTDRLSNRRACITSEGLSKNCPPKSRSLQVYIHMGPPGEESNYSPWPLPFLLLSLVDSRTQSNLLVPERSLLLAHDSVRADQSVTAHQDQRKVEKDILQGHHDRLIPSLLPVCRTARCLLSLLSLERSKLLSTLSTLFDTLHPLFVICLCLFPRSQDLLFSEEAVGVVGPFDVFLGSFKSCEFTFGGSRRGGIDEFLGCLESKVVEESKVRRCENLILALRLI